MKRTYDILTNYDFPITYRITGDYSANSFFADVVDENLTKKFSCSIAVTYSGTTGKSTIILTLSKSNIGLLTVGQTYYSDLKLDNTLETPLVEIILRVGAGKTTSSL